MALDEAALRKAFAMLVARVDALERATGLYASDDEMSGPRGDPEVKFSPRGWQGAPQVGQSMSGCDPDFLDVLAEALAWSAAHPKPGKEKYADYSRLDARRARTWGRRIRAGWTPTPPPKAAGRPGTNGAGERPASVGRPTAGRPVAAPRPGASRAPVTAAAPIAGDEAAGTASTADEDLFGPADDEGDLADEDFLT